MTDAVDSQLSAWFYFGAELNRLKWRKFNAVTHSQFVTFDELLRSSAMSSLRLGLVKAAASHRSRLSVADRELKDP